MHCKACGNLIDEDSRFCRFCGSPQSSSQIAEDSETDQTAANPPDNTAGSDPALKYVAWGGGAIFLLVIIIAASSGPNGAPEPLTETNLVAAVDQDVSLDFDANATDADAAHKPNWAYSTDQDKVRGATTHFATTTSTNSIYQDPPYDSETTMEMLVRKSPAYGTDVILTISSGQMMCPSYEGCEGTVRFDDGPAETLSFNGPADSSSDTIFVVGAERFIGKLKRSKKVVIEKTLYEAGNPQFEFNVEGLRWEH